MTVGPALALVLLSRTVTLDEAERSAAAHFPQNLVAHANTEAGEARTEQARSPLLPQVKLDAGYDRTTGNHVQKPGRPTVKNNTFQAFNWYQGALTGNLLLWDFGQTLNRWRAAQAHAVGLGDTELATRLEALAGVRLAFFRARAAKALVFVASETLANQQRHLEQIQGFVEAGTRPEIDLAQGRADVAQSRVQLIAAENGYVLSRASLNQAMGITADTDYDVADDALGPVQGENGPVHLLIDEAVRARPDIAALGEQVRAQELAARAARGAYFPTLSLHAGAAEAGLHLFEQTVPNPPFPPLTYGMTWNLFAGVQLTWPLFQGFLTRGQVREADAATDAARAQRDGLVQQVWVAVQQASNAVRSAKEALIAAEEVLTNANERLRLAEGRYAAGAGSVIELGDAQLQATRAAAQKVGAEYDLSDARAQLALALGQR
jgi:outer membrane protein